MATNPPNPPRPQTPPDTAETYERAQPAKEPGLGKMRQTDNTPHERPDSVRGSVRNDDDPPALAGQDDGNQADRVHPADPQAHAGQPDAAEDE